MTGHPNSDHAAVDYFATDELLGRLPPEAPEDPPGLRRDILDELADHLHCAAVREAAAGYSHDETRCRVLARFGSPAAIALRLWLDAQKGQRLMQRFTLGAAVTSTVLSLVALAAIVLMLSQQSKLLGAMTENAAALNELAAKFDASPPEPNQSSQQTDVTGSRKREEEGNCFIVFVLDEATGKPVRAVVTAKQIGGVNPTVFSDLPGTKSIVPVIERGSYALNITTESGFETSLTRKATPFEPTIVSLTVPSNPIARTGVVNVTGKFDVTWNVAIDEADTTDWLRPKPDESFALLITPIFEVYEKEGSDLWWSPSEFNDTIKQEHAEPVRFLRLGDGRLYRVTGGPDRPVGVVEGIPLRNRTFQLNGDETTTTLLDADFQLPIGTYQMMLQPVALPAGVDPASLDSVRLLAYDEDILQMSTDDPRPLSPNEAFRRDSLASVNFAATQRVTVQEDATAIIDLTFNPAAFDYEAAREQSRAAKQNGGFF